VTSLEQSAVTNAGANGAQLSAARGVELDACLVACSVTEPLVRSAAVAAVPDICTPMRLVLKLFEHAHCDSTPTLSLGRVRPTMLCGERAKVWAEQFCIDAVGVRVENAARGAQWTECRALWARHSASDSMCDPVTPFVVDDDTSDAAISVKRSRVERDESASLLHDTVGAVCWLRTGDGLCSVSAAVSSGGLLFKTPGRVGEAAIPGAGAWCVAGERACRAVSVSGVGEGVMQTQLARQFCSHSAAAAAAADDDDDEFHVATLRQHAPSVCDADAGVLTVSVAGGVAAVRAVFNTRSFGYGLVSSGDRRARVFMARQEGNGAPELTTIPARL
jgi:isoaspartyl peptidase/L-asparaginase-like protein (Ntn-hydrolase superfamily)